MKAAERNVGKSEDERSENKCIGSNTLPIGRFAPSPTGPLHFGSLIAATASYLAVKTKPEGTWFLRIEDVDTQREQQGASQSIIKTLEAYGFEWDGEILYQSKQDEFYQSALNKLNEDIYSCSCTRKYLQSLSTNETYGYIYPGICRDGINNSEIKQSSIRITTTDEEICFQDKCQPDLYCQNIEKEIGDFILKRSDGLFAYQLAVVVDDAYQGINQVVRGSDILDNTPRQIYLQRLLGYQQPDYLHFPTAVKADGKKLSKQNQSTAISTKKHTDNIKLKTLVAALDFLGQNPPKSSEFESLSDFWTWAFKYWDSENIPKVMNQLSEFE